MRAEPAAVPAPTSASPLLTLLLCDLVGSTALVDKLGDRRAAALMRRHDRLARDALHRYGGHEIDKTDGFLLLFEQPSRALAFALDYQRAVLEVGREFGVRVRARVVLHAGELQSWAHSADDVAAGAKPTEIAGRARSIVGEVLALARPGQILLTEAVAAPCRALMSDEAPDGRPLRWRAYAGIPLRGMPTPAVLYEVGEPRIAPLRGPQRAFAARWPRRWRLVGLFAAVVLLLAGAVGSWAWWRSDGLAFAERDWAVVTSLQNTTTQRELSEPIETVLRIGLQQSRYVNLVPPAQVQDALRRMRQPADRAVDRALGQQLALREGARVVIVPSLAADGAGYALAVGLVDPASGATVVQLTENAAELADLLPATDRLLARLRRRLGESLASIADSSGPLERITTSNLDALKALTSAEREFALGAVESGLRHLDEALRLDPEFAMALARRGIVELHWLDRPERALASWTQALSLADKLSERERRSLQALHDASFGNLAEAVGGWTTYLQLYPDGANGSHNLASALRHRQHRVADALPLYRRSAESRHPMRSLSWLALADSLVELGDLPAARAAIAEADALGMQAPMFNDVFPDLVERRYEDLQVRLEGRGELAPARQAERSLRLAAALTDQGRLREALALLDAIDVATLSRGQSARLQLQRIAMLLARGDDAAGPAIERLLALQQQRLQDSDPRLHRGLLLQTAFIASLAVRHGHAVAAAKAMALAERIGELPGHYVEPAFLRIARCETRHADHPPLRVECLRQLIDGREFYQAHVALADAMLAAGHFRDALEQTDWLLGQRGAAVAELEDWPLQLPNLVDANRAYLVAAAAAIELGEPDLASRGLIGFRHAWRQGDRDSLAWQQAERLRARLGAAGR